MDCHIIGPIVGVSTGLMYKSKCNISNRVTHFSSSPICQHHARGQFKTTRGHTFWIISIHICRSYMNRINRLHNNVLIDLLRTGGAFCKFNTNRSTTPFRRRILFKLYPCPVYHLLYRRGVFYLLSVITICFIRSKYCCSTTPWPAALTWRCCSRCFRWASAS